MAYSVYTPPGWTPEEHLPLMVLLHGVRDSESSFDKYAVGSVLDAEIEAGNTPRVIIVSPNGELGFWENWHDGSKLYRDWVVKDLIPHVAKRYVTLPCPQACFVSGISMGAHGAMRFAYYEPDTFSSVSAISAPIISKLHPGDPSLVQTIIKWFIPIERIWGDIDGDTSHVPKDLDPYKSWVNRSDMVEMPLLLTWGNNDRKSIAKANEHFHQHLVSHGKNHDMSIFDGGHNWESWREIMSEVIRFHFDSNEKRTIKIHN
ncbi:prolyl oligopeptidase family serine peptidase [Alteromonas sp. 5E99-2]|nr:prolyl oligopeptidase family serine peptidase [Alteromonas sp. 5E99-2]